MGRSRTKLVKRIVAASGGVVFLAAAIFAYATPVSAESGTLSLSPNKTSVVQGNTFAVSLRANTDAPITIAQARIVFNASAVSFQSISYDGSPLGSDVPGYGLSSGSFDVARFKFPDSLDNPNYPSGDIFIATLTFKALGNSGYAGLSVDQSSSALYGANSGGNILTSVSSSDVALQPIPAAPPSSSPQTPTPSGGSTTSTSSSSGSSSSGTPSSASNSNGSSTGDTNTTGDPDYSGVPQSAAISQSINNLPAPGKGKLGVQLSLSQRIAKILRTVLPAMGVLAIVGGVTWYAARRWRQRPFGFTTSHAAGSASGGSSGAGSVSGPASTSSSASSSERGEPKGAVFGGSDFTKE